MFARSLETMSLCAEIADDKANAADYKKLAADLKAKLFSIYWNDQKQALVHSRVDGKQTDNVTRYANMFGIFFNYFTEATKAGGKKISIAKRFYPKDNHTLHAVLRTGSLMCDG